jgi:DNA-binding transcriptional ArsR family regulator
MKTQFSNYQTEAQFLAALAHPARLEILELLRDGEACVCHVQAMLGQRQAYVSQHLNILKQAGLVTHRKDGLRVYYQLRYRDLSKVLDQVRSFVSDSVPQPVDRIVEERRRESCSCPQCSELKPASRLEVSNA